jgi:rod shape-determining protein MreB
MAKKVAIDLGTANSLVLIKGKGLVLAEPTVVAISLDDKKVLAIGKEAKDMLGKVPGNIVARRPLKNGVIASYNLTEALLKALLRKAGVQGLFSKPDVMISVPAGLTSVEERAVTEAAVSAGSGRVYLIPEPIAAGIGAELPISSSAGNMIVNMGGGTAEIAVISLNGIVNFESKRMSGDAINDALAGHIRRTQNLIIGEQMAEKVKIEIGSAIQLDNPAEMEVRGRDSNSGLPTAIIINSNDVVAPIQFVLKQIIDAVKRVLETTPPELASDIIDRGMVLSGGTAALNNIDELFTQITGVPAHVVDEPMYAVIRGLGIAINHIDVLSASLKIRQ